MGLKPPFLQVQKPAHLRESLKAGAATPRLTPSGGCGPD